MSARRDVWQIREGLSFVREENAVTVQLVLWDYLGKLAIVRAPLHGTYYGWAVGCPAFFEDEAQAHYYASAAYDAARFD